jgi:hypothetical protein
MNILISLFRHAARSRSIQSFMGLADSATTLRFAQNDKMDPATYAQDDKVKKAQDDKVREVQDNKVKTWFAQNNKEKK